MQLIITTTKVAFLKFSKTEEIPERVLKIGPNGFLEVIVKWLARYLTFRLRKIGQISNLAPKMKSSF